MSRLALMLTHPPILIILAVVAAGAGVVAADGRGWLWLVALAGVPAQMLNEYLLHRFVFHLPPPRAQWAFDLLYRAHYGHHDFPTNPRLFFAPGFVVLPVLAGNLAAVWGVLTLAGADWAVPGAAAVVAVGGGVTFLAYEWFHTTAHLPVPKTAVERHVARLHTQHHFRDTGKWFHVTAGGAVIDHAFGTAIGRADLAGQARAAFIRTLGMRPDDPRLVAARARFAGRYGLSAAEIARAARVTGGMRMERIVLAGRPEGEPDASHFRLEPLELPPLAEGAVMTRTLWLSLDPYMRGRMNAGRSYAAPVEVGDTMVGQVVAEVVESRDPAFAPGDLVVAPSGWATHGVAPGSALTRVPAGIPPQAALGVLGMPGMTAWVGLTRIAAAQPGETVIVSAAAGAVGSVACQLARARGLRVVGIAGGPEKCRIAVEEFGCDACLDHRGATARDLGRAIRAAVPGGAQVYFENVGGTVLEAVLPNMADFGRIALCGTIAWYSGSEGGPAAAALWRAILTMRLRVEGFIVTDHWAHFPAFLAEAAPMVADGRLRWRETVAEGLAAAPAAFLAMLKGGNLGKQLVRVG